MSQLQCVLFTTLLAPVVLLCFEVPEGVCVCVRVCVVLSFSLFALVSSP
jgi:hypothetical protein